MIKSELIERIAERIPTLYKRDAEHIVDAILVLLCHKITIG